MLVSTGVRQLSPLAAAWVRRAGAPPAAREAAAAVARGVFFATPGFDGAAVEAAVHTATALGRTEGGGVGVVDVEFSVGGYGITYARCVPELYDIELQLARSAAAGAADAEADGFEAETIAKLAVPPPPQQQPAPSVVLRVSCGVLLLPLLPEEASSSLVSSDSPPFEHHPVPIAAAAPGQRSAPPPPPPPPPPRRP